VSAKEKRRRPQKSEMNKNKKTFCNMLADFYFRFRLIKRMVYTKLRSFF
jgi:hypothetical protein